VGTVHVVGVVYTYEHRLCVISGFRREVAENCALLDYAASSGNLLPTFRDLSVSSSGFKSVRNVIFTDVSGRPNGLNLRVQVGKKLYFLHTFRDKLSVSISGFKSVRNVVIFTDVSGQHIGLNLRVEVGKKCGNFYRRFGTTYRSHPQGSSR